MHFTDPHLFADTSESFRGTVTHRSFVRVLDHYLDNDWQADLVTCTGDLIQDGSEAAYARFTAEAERLELPVHCVPGNHDVRELMQRAVATPPFFYCDATEIGNWLIVGVDSCKTDRAGGAIDGEEYDRLDAAINASDADHVMVCLHHPPVVMGSKWLDTVGLDDAEIFYKRVSASGKVRLAIFGHVHQAYDDEHHGIRILGTPSTCRQFKPHSDDFDVDDKPPAYRHISLHENGDMETQLVWVADA